MNVDIATDIINKAVEVTLIGSMPTVVLGLLAGVIVAVVQAVTQIQEQTLTFVPKMIVVLLVFAATFAWLSGILMELAISLWQNIPQYSK